MYKKTN